MMMKRMQRKTRTGPEEGEERSDGGKKELGNETGRDKRRRREEDRRRGEPVNLTRQVK